MAKVPYIGVDGVARKCKSLYIGVDGVARKVKSGYIGVNGVAKQFYMGDPVYSASPSGSFLTFVSPNSFSINTLKTSKSWNGVLEYFTVDGTWAEWDGSKISSAIGEDGHALYFRGTDNTVITGAVRSNFYEWKITGADVQCNGNIETLLDHSTVESGGHPIMEYCCFSFLFYGCGALTKAPSLPATTLSERCYYYMFRGTSLTTAPSLPATTLTNNCYSYMFSACDDLLTLPALPATTLESYCYNSMFKGCYSIKLSTSKTEEYTKAYRIPLSGAGTTASSALTDMFHNTGGTFTGTPTINTTYYLSSSNEIV